MMTCRTAAALAGFLILPAMVVGAPVGAQAASSSNIPGTSCPNFPASSWWHADVSKLKVHPRSAAWMSRMSSQRKLHPDFGPSYGELDGPYGIPITVVDSSHPKVKVAFDYASESDPGPYPLGPRTKVEGWSFTAPGDKHTIVVDKSTCKLYETWNTRKKGGSWIAGSGAIWSLKSNKLRPLHWTSADAAGLPILPGLLRYDEVKRGNVDHAIRFTTNITDKRFIWPARHHAGSVSDRNYPPMGARFRLKSSYKIKASLRADTKVVLRAMKKHGLVLADNGTPWYFQGTADTRWPDGFIAELKTIPASAFEAVDTLPLRIKNGTMKVNQ
jgi:hypothetical protein